MNIMVVEHKFLGYPSLARCSLSGKLMSKDLVYRW